MKKRKSAIIIVSIIIITGILFYLSNTGFKKKVLKIHPTETAIAQQTAPAGHAGHSGTPPSQQSKEQPAEQAKEQKEAEEAPTVEIPLEKQQMIGVRTIEVSIKPLQKVVRTVGRIEYDEKKLATVNTKFEGWIEKLYIDYTGRYVKKGEPLAEIYSPELVATQQEFINVLRWAKQSREIKNDTINKMLSRDAEAIVEAAKQRLRLWDISENQIKKIEESEKPERTLAIYSPVNGYVVQKMVLQGMRVMPGEKLFDIADLSTVWVISDIYEYELPLIKVGDTARITLSYFPGKEFSSKIDYVYPSLSGDTRTAKVRFSLPNPGGQLKPQMFTNVEIKINIGKKLAIPEDSVIDTGTRQIVYVDKGEGYFEPKEVSLGIKADGMVEVLKGLKAGEKVASAANFLIDSEARLKGIVK